MKKLKKKYLIKGALISFLLLIVITGSSFVDNYFEISKNLDIFATLYKEISIYYVDETKPDDLMKKGIDGMLSSLDPYTTYIPEAEIEEYKYMTTGHYGGIGSIIRRKGEYSMIAEPYEGYPAQKGGLKAGDIILEIDGKSAKEKTTDELSKALKGKPNTIVHLKVQREGQQEPIEKDIERAEIKVNSVSYSGIISDHIGYISLTGFTENAAREVKEALIELKKDNDLKGIILDLRNNPGGLLTESVNIVNHFVQKGIDIVHTKGKVEEWNKTYKSINTPVDTSIKLILLVNGGSASASEIVSGTLQDLDRAVILGQKTFGKGLVQTTRSLSYNTKLKVTTAKYYIPSGRCIQALDYHNRKADGTVEKIADSLKTPFKTKCGRTVFDAGGIIPDIEVEPKVVPQIAASLSNKLLFFDFATKYAIGHETIPEPGKFHLTEKEYEDFIAFVSGKDYTYKTKSEALLEEFKTISENEKSFENITQDYNALQKKIVQNKSADLVTFKKEITTVLEAEISTRYYYSKGRIRTNIQHDPVIEKAKNILLTSKVYEQILAGKYSPANEKK